jgi:hypothetical protein
VLSSCYLRCHTRQRATAPSSLLQSPCPVVYCRVLRYRSLQHPEDDKELDRFWGTSCGGQGYFDIASANPRQLLVAPVLTLSPVHAVSARRPVEDVVKHLNANEQKALARRLGGHPTRHGHDAERAELLRTNLALHQDSVTNDIIETCTACNPDYIAVVNKAKLKASEGPATKGRAGVTSRLEATWG